MNGENTRQAGYYYVRLLNSTRWTIAEFYQDDSDWEILGSTWYLRDNDLAEIGPRIPSPDEAQPAPTPACPVTAQKLREIANEMPMGRSRGLVERLAHWLEQQARAERPRVTLTREQVRSIRALSLVCFLPEESFCKKVTEELGIEVSE